MEQAAAGLIAERCAASDSTLAVLIALLEDALFADLAGAIGVLVVAVENRAALSPDIHQLLAAVPPLVSVQRYGNVRETDVSMVGEILRGLVPRVFVALPAAVVGIDDDAARTLHAGIVAADAALANLGDAGFTAGWRDTLLRISRNDAAHPLLAGHALRLLYDAQVVEFDALRQSFSLSLSPGNPPGQAAAWTEGFLSGSGTILIHDEKLLGLIDGWLGGVSDEHFMLVLPLLRRTFAQFPPAERRQIGERLKPRAAAAANVVAIDFDTEAARAVLPVLRADLETRSRLMSDPRIEEERAARRWRLVLGGEQADGIGWRLDQNDVAMDRALQALYDSDRRGGLGSSAPSVARWLGDIREYFPASVVQVMQRDAIERLDMKSLLMEPEMLQTLEPDVHLVADLLSLSGAIPAKTRDTARMVVRRVVDALIAKLADPMRQAVHRRPQPFGAQPAPEAPRHRLAAHHPRQPQALST